MTIHFHKDKLFKAARSYSEHDPEEHTEHHAEDKFFQATWKGKRWGVWNRGDWTLGGGGVLLTFVLFQCMSVRGDDRGMHRAHRL